MIERRQFLKTLGLAGSAAVLDACARQPGDELIPYFVSADAVVAGMPAHYATTCRACPAGCGMIAKAVNGRVTKVEGNPQHPIGRGRLCARGQASVQSVYNPFRFRQPLQRDSNGTLQERSWPEAEQVLADRLRDASRRGPNRIAWLGRLETGPIDALVTSWLAALDSTRYVMYETFDHHALRTAAALACGHAEIPHYDFERAEFVLAFGAEFLETWISNVEFTAAYSRLRARRLHDPAGSFVWVAPRLSLTGLNADGWIATPPGSEAAIACAIANVMIAEGLVQPSAVENLPGLRGALDRFAPDAVARATGASSDGIRTAARRFARPAASLALGGGSAACGDRGAVALEVAVLLLNALNGNIGSTVTFGARHALGRVATSQDLVALTEAMGAGSVDVLLVRHANPVYTLPPALGFESALGRVPFIANFGSLQDETTDRAHLVLPDHHDLESWGTYSPRGDIVGSMQPAAMPLFDTRATADVLVEVAHRIGRGVARATGDMTWRDRLQQWWGAGHEETVRDGGRLTSEIAPVRVALRDVSATIAAIPLASSDSALTVIAYPTTQHFDGRSADSAWLQELPDPVTKAVWGNCLEIHPETARRLGIRDDDDVEVTSPHGRVRARARLSAGLHPNAIGMALGFGRTPSMRFADARGANAIRILPSFRDNPGAVWRVGGVTLQRVSGGTRLIVLQQTMSPQGESSDARLTSPARVDDRHPGPPKAVDFYPPHEHKEHRWGMAVDLNACTGCSACVVACYAENNIPTVGPQLCEQGREMSWIRIERTVHELEEQHGLKPPGSEFLPMLCQHCDNAPCESVCPVYATYHNPEGLNAQVYVRCIGTRFCSNNCPYKVRRFNWARYSWTAPLGEQLNPDVTVRSVGVMEKCTFCVQRIQAGKSQAAREQRALRDGDIATACAQTCPADAIVFGDLRDPNSRVSKLSQLARGYRALEELNTKPAITYLRRVVPGAPDRVG